jgi:hypothetical protein
MNELTDSEKLDIIYKDMLVMKKESRSQAIESKIQTIALLFVFFVGVATVSDLLKKLKIK